MLLGLVDDEKKFKDAMNAAGADMAKVKAWLKVFSKTRKNAFNTAGRYYSVKERLQTLLQSLKGLEHMLIEAKGLSLDKAKVAQYSKEFKKMQGGFNDEFLISKEDKDFQTTLESVVKLTAGYKEGADCLIMQSEVENLIYLTQEGLDREKPDMFALAYFYLERSNKDLEELNFQQKVNKVSEIFETEFIEQIRSELIAGVKMAEALNDRYEGSLDKKTKGLLNDLEPLLDRKDEDIPLEVKADYILKKMCTV